MPTPDDFTRAADLTPEVDTAVEIALRYTSWNEEQIEKGRQVRTAVAAAIKTIVKNVPPCPDRSSAIRAMREGAMWANAAISHKGKH